MIKYTLNCKNGHQFDSWFSDSESFEKLKKKGTWSVLYALQKKLRSL